MQIFVEKVVKFGHDAGVEYFADLELTRIIAHAVIKQQGNT